MKAQQTNGLTRKGAQTRDRILETALRLFVEKGYEATTMRDIAAAAETSLGLAYRYFASKDELVLALYQRLLEQMEDEVGRLPVVPLAERFYQAMQIKITQLQPYREVFGALFGAALTPQSSVAVLGEGTTGIRRRSSDAFLTVVSGATDAPRGQQARDLATVLYAAHMALILFWLHDRSPNARATNEMLALARDILVIGRRLLRFPPIAKILARLAMALEPVFTSGL
jgi:AcrR family transcriptional regulator